MNKQGISIRQQLIAKLEESIDFTMSAAPEFSAPPAADLELAADQAIAACGGDAREAVKALIVANGFLETQVDELRSAVSSGYARGRYDRVREREE
ncbi:hypothetical protein [Bradyrhizobium sp. CCBAU 53338]|uniref:hypothetical protein n=1 Tax=Bradyrhizobium sp. CCBAU 53338 TaxID=1325111 RepID=UPI00352E7A55